MPQAAEILAIQLYRAAPGDLGIGNIPAVGEGDLSAAKQAAKDALVNYFSDPRRRSGEKPNAARLIRAVDGQVMAEYSMRPKGPVEVPLPGGGGFTHIKRA